MEGSANPTTSERDYLDKLLRTQTASLTTTVNDGIIAVLCSGVSYRRTQYNLSEPTSFPLELSIRALVGLVVLPHS